MTIDKEYKCVHLVTASDTPRKCVRCMTASYPFRGRGEGCRDGRKRADHTAAREREPRADRRVPQREHVAREPLRPGPRGDPGPQAGSRQDDRQGGLGIDGNEGRGHTAMTHDLGVEDAGRKEPPDAGKGKKGWDLS